MGKIKSNSRYLLIAICLLLGNFVIFHDRERLVLAEIIEEESLLGPLDNIDVSSKGKGSCCATSE